MQIFTPLERVHNQSGGTNGRVVRLSSANTWVDASSTDNAVGLNFLMFLQGGIYLPPGEIIYGLSGLTAGASYYLGSSGNITSTPPANPVLIGQALDATTLFFYPKRGGASGISGTQTVIYHNLLGAGVGSGVMPNLDHAARIQAKVETLPGYGSSLYGFWLLGYDMVANESAANNQTVKDWSTYGNDGLRGNSTTPNTSSPNGVVFGGDDYVLVPYDASMYAEERGDVSFGAVYNRQGNTASSRLMAQNANDRGLVFSGGFAIGAISALGYFSTNPVLTNTEHRMVAGKGTINRINLFLNGVANGARTISTYGADVSNQPLYIGANSPGSLPYTGDLYCAYGYTSDQSANAAQINTTINEILTTINEINDNQ